MGSKFLSDLDLSADEKAKLASLAAPSPAAVLSMRRAAPEAFDGLFGKERADQIAARLENQLTPEEKQRLESSVPVKRFPLGASLGTPPSHLPPPKFDIEERDQIFEQLQALRKLDSPSTEQTKRKSELEDRLNALLEST
jgi:hypothetical protein